MKITQIETYAVYNGARNNLFVTVDTDEGISGVGESGLSGRELAVIGAVDHCKPLLIGQDASRIEHLWQVLFRGGFFPANRVLCSAISAIDIALWDIQGKALGVPVFRLLGGLSRDKVVCYPHAQTPGEGDDVGCHQLDRKLAEPDQRPGHDRPGRRPLPPAGLGRRPGERRPNLGRTHRGLRLPGHRPPVHRPEPSGGVRRAGGRPPLGEGAAVLSLGLRGRGDGGTVGCPAEASGCLVTPAASKADVTE